MGGVDWNMVLLSVIGTLLIVGVGMVGWYIKSLRSIFMVELEKIGKDLRDYKQGFDSELRSIRKDLGDFRVEVAEKYINQDDFFRNLGAVAGQVDKKFDMIMAALCGPRQETKHGC